MGYIFKAYNYSCKAVLCCFFSKITSHFSCCTSLWCVEYLDFSKLFFWRLLFNNFFLQNGWNILFFL